ncbi:MAG: hypothetical protein LBU65_09405 [Planctomycetaceae bacterium]|jgi:hypothetical protein|nr:hypothetical protein [Planctomycetaceae bacterium]
MRNTNFYEQVSNSDTNNELPETFQHVQTSGRIIASMPDLDENFPSIPLPASLASAIPSATSNVSPSARINILPNELAVNELPTELPVAQTFSDVRLNSPSSFGQNVASQKFSHDFKFHLSNISYKIRFAGVLGLLFVFGVTTIILNGKSSTNNEPTDSSTVYKPVEQAHNEIASVNQTVDGEQNKNNRRQNIHNEFSSEQFTDHATASTPDSANAASTDSNSVWNREPSSEYSPWDYSSTANQNVYPNVNSNVTHTASVDERPVLTPAAPLVIPPVANNVNNNVGNNGNNRAAGIGFEDFASNELPDNVNIQYGMNNANNVNQPQQETMLPNYSYYAANGQPNATNTAAAMPNNGQYNDVQSQQLPPANQSHNQAINQVANVVPNGYQTPRSNSGVPVAEGFSTITSTGYPNRQPIQTIPSVQTHSMHNPVAVPSVAYQGGYNAPTYPQPYYHQSQPVQQNNYPPQYQAYQQQYANQYNQPQTQYHQQPPQQYQQTMYQQPYQHRDTPRIAQVPPVQTSPPQVYVNPQYNVPAYNVPEGGAVPPPTSRELF